jgi:hypothetical protein
MTAGESGDTARRAGGLVPTGTGPRRVCRALGIFGIEQQSGIKAGRGWTCSMVADAATQSPMIAAEAHSPGQGKGDCGDVFSCFSLDLNRPACPASALPALAHAVESHDNSSVHRLGRTRVVRPTSVMDGKVRAPQMEEVPRHERVSLSQ